MRPDLQADNEHTNSSMSGVPVSNVNQGAEARKCKGGKQKKSYSCLRMQSVLILVALSVLESYLCWTCFVTK